MGIKVFSLDFFVEIADQDYEQYLYFEIACNVCKRYNNFIINRHY